MRNPENWKANKAKQARNSGAPGKTKGGTPINQKVMSLGCANCRFKCHESIGYKDRLQLFNEFYGIGNRTGQCNFLDRLITVAEPSKILDDGS